MVKTGANGQTYHINLKKKYMVDVDTQRVHIMRNYIFLVAALCLIEKDKLENVHLKYLFLIRLTILIMF
mgnify:CR=1 FL=1